MSTANKAETKTYEVNLTEDDATIVGRPDVYLHFAHHDFDIVWNEETKRQDVAQGVHTYYGGMGEGASFSTWSDAVLASLYDAYQVYEGFHSGDIFSVTYHKDRRYFLCDGCHVVSL